MPVVNFSITKPLERDIKEVIKKRGFTSKAEFFRFAAWDAIKDFRHPKESIDERFEIEMNALADTIHRKLGGKKLPSPEDQLADLF
ncbi:MAG: ribbon-helix-helix domain-containing protein [bacterium]|nr:ribbon-helix-helix domain-containing protein [bacterium]